MFNPSWTLNPDATESSSVLPGVPGWGRMDMLREGLLKATRDTVRPRDVDGFDMLLMKLEYNCES
tara:strand:+ start:420 stop:614 length:195 start_codon:yes stop_codon:yes gene_type:complete